jgi:hypothetical protein
MPASVGEVSLLPRLLDQGTVLRQSCCCWRQTQNAARQHVPTLDQLQEKQSREFALRILEYEVISVNSHDRRDHVLSGLAGRLERNEVGLVNHGRNCNAGAEALPGEPRT